MEHKFEDMPSPFEEAVARDTLERYSGSSVEEFQPLVLLTNFPQYVRYFASSREIPIIQGSMFTCAHSVKDKITILDFKIGSPAAALAVDLLAYLPIEATLFLGMCGGLRRQFKVGDYFVPIASIRNEGTSDFYFPQEVPALANFLVQKQATNALEASHIVYHIGITHTMNKRFWEFDQLFRAHLVATRPQAIEMECATLFIASYRHKLPLGALLLISDLPLEREGQKTKKSSASVFEKHTQEHVELGVGVLTNVQKALKKQVKGAFRGSRRRFEKPPPAT